MKMKLTVGLLIKYLQELPSNIPVCEYSEHHKKDIEIPDDCEKKLKHQESPFQLYEEHGYARLLVSLPPHIDYPKGSDSVFNDSPVWDRVMRLKKDGKIN